MTQTTNYKLNQWAPEDRILRENFNADNQKLDAALAGAASGLAQERTDRANAVTGAKNEAAAAVAAEKTAREKAVSAEKTAREQAVAAEKTAREAADTTLRNSKAEVLVGFYTGNDAENRFISLGKTPKAVYVCRDDGLSMSSYNRQFAGGLAVTGHPLQDEGALVLDIATNGFNVHQLEPAGRHGKIDTNRAETIYHYLALI